MSKPETVMSLSDDNTDLTVSTGDKIAVAFGLILSLGLLVALYLMLVVTPKPTAAAYITECLPHQSALTQRPAVPAEPTLPMAEPDSEAAFADEQPDQDAVAASNTPSTSDPLVADQAVSTSSGGSSTSSSASVWHPAWDETVLVSAAWDEVLYHPAEYETVIHPAVFRDVSQCNFCGMEITGFASDHLMASADCGSYSTFWDLVSPTRFENVLVREAWSETIHHPAIYRTIHHEGYWQ